MPTRTAAPTYPATPDGRYFVVRGRLWRCSRPDLGTVERRRLTRELMQARRAVGQALRRADAAAVKAARARVDAAKRALGERGAVWWQDGAPDYNRRLVRHTPYRRWHERLVAAAERREQAAPTRDEAAADTPDDASVEARSDDAAGG